MRILAYALLVPCALMLTACPAPDDPEDVEVPPAAEMAQLQELEGSGTTGEVAVTSRDDETHIVVEVANAPQDETLDVTIHSGTCQNPGEEVRDIGTIRTTDLGSGAIESTVRDEPHRYFDGNHVAVVWAPLDRDDNGIMDLNGDDERATDRDRQDRADDYDRTDRDETGLVRDDRRAIACAALPAH